MLNADVTTSRGLTLLAVAIGYGVVGAVLFLRRLNRDLALLLIALGLTAAANAAVDLLSGATLAISWAAEAAVLSWLAWLTKEARFRLGAVVYLMLALGHTLVIDAPPSHLFTIVHNPISGLTSVAAVVLASLVIVAFSGASRRPALAEFDLLICSPVALYGVCAALAICALIASLQEQLVARTPALRLVSLALELGAFALAAIADHEALNSLRMQGVGLIALAAFASLLAAALYRFRHEQRDFAALFVAIGVVLAVVGIELASTAVVFCLAALALTVTLGGLRVSDWRLLSLALIPIAVGLWTSLGGQASPRYLFVASAHPGRGVPALAALAAAGAATVWAARTIRVSDSWAALIEELSGYLRWVFGVVALYLLSLAVLEIAQILNPGTLTSGLQRGHTAISACWGVLGLVLLYLGLTRTSKAIRLAGLTLLGASLAKLFLYDLSFLSSVQRAVSFLAVGAMLLAGGFFYQRLAARLTDEQMNTGD